MYLHSVRLQFSLPPAKHNFALSSQQLAEYASEGYLVLKEVIDHKTIQQLTDRITSHIRRFGDRLRESQLQYQNTANAPIELKNGEDKSAIFVLGKPPEDYKERDYVMLSKESIG
ncbi:MAG TPA: hypothetical protein PKD37_08205 [Oligoflexia bacterium]|nr:hypothetical protein [Oligoflexia bacterium]HMP27946.1 hypothetical protein [Oligoflexia bacterium]